MKGQKNSDFSQLLRTILGGLLCMMGGAIVFADHLEEQMVSQAYVASFVESAPSGGQANNLNWSNQGLTQFRRNLQATYLSEVIPISLSDLDPFFTLTLNAQILNFDPSLVRIEVRFSQTKEDWSPWQTLTAFHEEEADANHFNSNMLIVEQAANRFQYLIVMERASAGSLPIWIQKLDIHLFTPSVDPIQPSSLMNLHYASQDTGCLCPMPAYATRTAWGCPDGQNFSGDGAPVYLPTTHLIVHHSASNNTSNNWAAVVLAIWNLHTVSNGWDDIGYNWLIDPNGVVYEGRGGGNNVRGAHFCGSNSNTMGVCMIGTYSDVPATPAAMQSLSRLLAWKNCNSDLDPAAQTFHNSSGLTLSTISGHRDGCNTLCPGDSLYARLPVLRTDVADIVDTCALVLASVQPILVPSFQLYPNPAQGQFSLRWETAYNWNGQLSMLNMMGQEVYRQAIRILPFQAPLTVRPPQTLKTGMYLVRLIDADQIWSEKLYWIP